MIFYSLYRLGHAIALALPLRLAYAVACRMADIHFFLSPRERRAVRENLKVVLGAADRAVGTRELDRMAREVFRNFAKYLVDFFRFSTIDDDYLARRVTIQGIENVAKALARGKGGIALSVHLGNWELGGLVLARKGGHPLHAVVLTHRHRKINDFFTRQRLLGNVIPIEFGISLRRCYTVLKGNGLLALLGDRDFSKSGIPIDFFGKQAVIPKGPSVFGCRIGTAIIPTFMIREHNDTFRLVLEEPIYAAADAPDEEAAVRSLMHQYLPVIERYIARYPTQWYVFRRMWNTDARSLRSNSVI